MTALPKRQFTAQEYLAIERAAQFKSEFYKGEMFAMAGATEAHDLIVTNLIREIGNALKGRSCRVYSSDMRVKVTASGLYTYPDVSVLCGTSLFEDERRDTLLNPSLIVEVLSDSTEAYVRGKKFDHYRGLSSLQEYILIPQDDRKVEHYIRGQEERWLFSAVRGPVVEFPSIQCELALAEIFANVTLG